MTFKDACEFISEVVFRMDGRRLDPERDVFAMDPRGELWPVVEAYEQALAVNARLPDPVPVPD